MMILQGTYSIDVIKRSTPVRSTNAPALHERPCDMPTTPHFKSSIGPPLMPSVTCRSTNPEGFTDHRTSAGLETHTEPSLSLRGGPAMLTIREKSTFNAKEELKWEKGMNAIEKRVLG